MKAVKFLVFLLAISLSACGAFPDAAQPLTFFAAPTAIPWQTYQSPLYGFSFQYPPDAVKSEGGDDASFTLNLPSLPASNIIGKYLNVTVSENQSACPGTYGGLEFVKNVGMNDITFLYESGHYTTGRNVADWVSYSTARHNICVNLVLVLLPGEAGNYVNTVNSVDRMKETKVFQRMLLTFGWTTR